VFPNTLTRPLRIDPLDEELVERARAGDMRSFETLVTRHHDVVLRVATRIVGENDAADVAQDAFLRAFHRLSAFRGDAPFRTWLLRIAHNSALDAVARRRRVEPLDDLEARTETGGVTGGELIGVPVHRLEVKERRERLATKLRLLTPPHRAVLVLRDLEGLSYEEIAEVTDAPLGSVKGRLHRARREFIELLRANTYDWELPDGA
jgi:RNA polymerase sigma-70 factor, ECF subfamily